MGKVLNLLLKAPFIVKKHAGTKCSGTEEKEQDKKGGGRGRVKIDKKNRLLTKKG